MTETRTVVYRTWIGRLWLGAARESKRRWFAWTLHRPTRNRGWLALVQFGWWSVSIGWINMRRSNPAYVPRWGPAYIMVEELFQTHSEDFAGLFTTIIELLDDRDHEILKLRRALQFCAEPYQLQLMPGSSWSDAEPQIDYADLSREFDYRQRLAASLAMRG